MKKTNAARLLDKLGINYEIIKYQFDENDLSAEKVAGELGQDIQSIFKTLVLRGNTTGVFVVLVPGNTEIDLKKAAKFSGNKNATMVQMKELHGLTGYIRGGCSPLAMKKQYPVFIHESCMGFESIYISAGKRGMQVKLPPLNLIKCTGATVCNIIIS